MLVLVGDARCSRRSSPRAFRSAALLAATVALGGALVELLKTQPAEPARHRWAAWPSAPDAAGRAVTPRCSARSRSASCSGGGARVCPARRSWPRSCFRLPRRSATAARYLGIHWLSEVFAGWCVAVVAGVGRVDRRSAARGPVRDPATPEAVARGRRRRRRARRDRDRDPGRPARPGRATERGRAASARPTSVSRAPAQTFTPTQLTSADPAALIDPLPRFTETLLGRRSLPVGLVVAATSDQLQARVRAVRLDRSRRVLTPRSGPQPLGRAHGEKPIAARRPCRPSSTRAPPTRCSRARRRAAAPQRKRLRCGKSRW